MGWQTDLLAEFDRDFQNGSISAFAIFTADARKSPSMPRDSGKLAAGLKLTVEGVNAGRAEATIASTARSADGADYGSIIDQASGKTIKPVRKQALANTGSGWGPYASAKQSTKHVGWFDKVTSQAVFDQALDRGLRPFDL